MKKIFLTALALTLLTSSLAFGAVNTMTAFETDSFGQGLKNALVRQPVKSCQRNYMNTINSKLSTNQRSCQDEASQTIMVRIDSPDWHGSQTVKEDGRVEIRLINIGQANSQNNGSLIQKAEQEMIVILNSQRTQVLEISLHTIVRVKGEVNNTGTITNPVFEPSQDIYEDKMLATY